MNWDDFKVGFWHPFGPYTGRSPEEILEWKRCEIERCGWTLWSFVHSRSTAEWLEILGNQNGPVYVLCSFSPKARDPDRHYGTRRATHYRYMSESEWQAMPDPEDMYVTNPFIRRGRALAFKVGRVLEVPPQAPLFQVHWFSRTRKTWRDTATLPTRGEFLIRRDGPARLRPVRAVLELVEPYLAELKYDL